MQLQNPGAIIEETIRYRTLKQYFSTIRNKAVLLDLGCGRRPYQHLYQNSFARTIGAELPDTPFPTDSIDLFCEATSIPLADESIDTILCTEVMHDIAEPGRMLDETWRILKKEGEMILTTPFMVPIVDGEYDCYRFTRHGLRYLFKKSGFEIISIQPVGDIFSSMITISVKPMLKFFNILSKKTGLRMLYSRWNPFLLLFVYLPQAVYLWTSGLPLIRHLYHRFDYGCTGYICHVKRPA